MPGDPDLAEHEGGNERAQPGHDGAAQQTAKGPRRMTDDEPQDWVREELFWDPKVDSAAIAVSANDGEVTLRGTVVASARSARRRRRPSACTASPRCATNSMCGSLTSKDGRTSTCAGPCCRRWRWTASSPRRSMPRPTAAW